jgi:site-specific recombinase XerC
MRAFRTFFDGGQAGQCPDISLYVDRRTFATRLAEKGVDLRTIQDLGRRARASLSMVQRYSNISEGHKAEAIEKLSQEPAGASAATVADIANRRKTPVR